MEQEKQRIIQEFVPGKQVTLAHVIANPDSSLYKKLGVIGDYTGALGIMTITPSEGAIIGADVAMKAANVEVVFVDRFNGSLIINGTVADVEAAVKDVLNVLENMKKIILIGNVACGKTTICQYLNHMEIKYKKTQALEVYNTTIDTPGEYLENRGYLRSLMVTATETDQVVFVQDASRDQFFFSPGQSSAFTLPVAGVVTKIDIATPKQIADAVELLQLAGADPIFKVSPMTGEGMEELAAFLEEKEAAAED